MGGTDMQHKDTGHEGQTKTMKVVGLFAAAALAVAATGCSSQPAQQPVPISQQQAGAGQSDLTLNQNDVCEDDNNDGYCDNDTSTRIHSGSSFVYIGGKKHYYKTGRAPVVQSQKPQDNNSGSGSSSGGSPGSDRIRRIEA